MDEKARLNVEKAITYMSNSSPEEILVRKFFSLNALNCPL